MLNHDWLLVFLWPKIVSVPNHFLREQLLIRSSFRLGFFLSSKAYPGFFYVYLGLLKCLANAIRNIWDQPLRKSLGEDIHLTWKCERQLIICHRHWSCSLHHLHLHLARVGNPYGPGSSGFKMKKEEKLTVRSPPGSSVKVYKILEIVPKKWNELGIFYICFLFSYTKK